MKLFISYRRSDSTHAAHRARMCLQQKFGQDAVFIDREIPAGKPWHQHLEEMLQASTGVVVLVGDEFLRLLRQKQGAAGQPDGGLGDPLVWEIATAIRLEKPIYPVLFGQLDMPDAARLPEAMRAFASYQAVFAREPAFDAAMSVLIKSIAVQHDWVDPPPALPPAAAAAAATPGHAQPGPLAWAAAALATAALAWLLLWWAGRLILWLADAGSAPLRPAESAFWHGARYTLATLLGGLGPYLAYRLVAELRARARLPIYNLHGMLSVVNLAGLLVSGGTFLLLSTLPGWRLQPLLVFPAQPGPLHYALLALGLLAIVVAAVAVAVWEPQVRQWPPARRSAGMLAINATSVVLGVCGLWFFASLAHSLPALGAMDPVPVVGYLMLCPALSLLVAGWAHGQAVLGLRSSDPHHRALFGLVLGLYALCTLALFAYGPTRLLAPGI